MIELRQTSVFSDWLRALKDVRGAAKIQVRIDRLLDGNPGDSKSVGGGVMEMRIDYGPGYRVYFTQKRGVFVLLLCGGDKSSQSKDIARAHELASELKD
ncbi:type II toxin-antitoxin system RelE/ParE family toxin [Burkholderia glumae]|uniref:type II toxin-antitoxin system RelE/ParE family toxin n=1 Tax=Burkholderia glumae TaxID=337 RepID=UPI000365D2E8|nr:type II toxin-antitoxin system RelE/ParE family toxin [Burkholderia glumae]PJO23700.1 type II toxin-antitoxin system RelE/ParE family toxin [Burkholderia glumae AU6208]QHE09825.1 type II toxin-antitoxin system RelE/ParE family toxin [Burkholderia glumae AU6208]